MAKNRKEQFIDAGRIESPKLSQMKRCKANLMKRLNSARPDSSN